jgi:myo-inositol 2-dehydrogenase/D-chiro-inositol 1-dehydrogenase
LVAVCTTEPHEIEWARSNAEYAEFGIAVYEDDDNMLASQSDLHAVWVSTSTDVHAIQSLKAIEKGLHVLCEKPISTDLAEVSPLLHTPSSPITYRNHGERTDGDA